MFNCQLVCLLSTSTISSATLPEEVKYISTSSFSQQSTLQRIKHLTMDLHPLFQSQSSSLVTKRLWIRADFKVTQSGVTFPPHGFLSSPETLQTSFVLFGERRRTYESLRTSLKKNWQYTLATDHKNTTLYDNIIKTHWCYCFMIYPRLPLKEYSH